METIIVVVHLVVAVIIVGLVLLQQGKGADAGASFGAGASQTVFGASGSGNFLVRATTIAAVIFFIPSLSLSLVAKNQTGFSSTTGLPVVSPEVLERVSEVEADVPQLEASPTTENTQEDLPNLPSN